MGQPSNRDEVRPSTISSLRERGPANAGHIPQGAAKSKTEQRASAHAGYLTSGRVISEGPGGLLDPVLSTHGAPPRAQTGHAERTDSKITMAADRRRAV